MPTKRIQKSEPEVVYIGAPQVCERYGNRSHMWLVGMLKHDPTFPRPQKFGRLNFYKLDDLIAWERKAAVKSKRAAVEAAE